MSWLPGSDLLQGDCRCGARIEGEDPTSVWDWLTAHPDHPHDLRPATAPSTPHLPPAHLVGRAGVIGRRVVPPA